LLALRWKFLITNTTLTHRLTAPFGWLFRPWILWPMLAAFVAVCWFVLIDKGVASATADAFHTPAMLLGIFALAVLSAAFHELGHAAACRYGGATPGGMGAGLYLVWPAFYTDVTDAYRLDRRSRLRVDLAGLYFNAIVAVATTGVWLVSRRDSLLLLVALQLVMMVRQLSPIIRADGYHILADATGVPDLFAHLGPTLRRLLPAHRHEPSALTGKARALVTVWVLVVVPVLLSLMVGAVLLLPRLATSAWESGRHIAEEIPHEGALRVAASVLQLIALLLPVFGSALVTQRLVRSGVRRAWKWSRGSASRKAVAGVAAAAIAAGLAWAWWPAGQYQPVRASDHGTLPGFARMLGSPSSAIRPVATGPAIAPGRRLALAMVPVGGPSASHPAMLVLPATHGSTPAALLTDAAPALNSTAGDGQPKSGISGSPAPAGATTANPASSSPAVAFPFKLPKAPPPGGTQAEALGTKDGGVVYNVAYAIVTVTDGAPVNESNSAFAIAHCVQCTTVAVSFQVILIVGQSNEIAPINAAGALNYKCPACMTTALADQLVVTLKAQPSAALSQELENTLAELDALPLLGAKATPQAVAAQVQIVAQQIDSELAESGLVAATPSLQPTISVSPSAPISTGSQASTSVPIASIPGSTMTQAPTPTPTPSPSVSPAPSPTTPTPNPTPTPSPTLSPSPPSS
jgi:putative peptide zinc metalloprotease protein